MASTSSRGERAPAGHYRAGLQLARHGRWAQAVARLERVPVDDALYVEAQHAAGEILQYRQPARAAWHFTRAMRAAPAADVDLLARICYNRGVSLHQAGRYVEAMEDFRYVLTYLAPARNESLNDRASWWLWSSARHQLLMTALDAEAAGIDLPPAMRRLAYQGKPGRDEYPRAGFA